MIRLVYDCNDKCKTVFQYTVTDLVQNLDEMNCVKSKDSKKYEWAATGCGVRIKLKN